MRNKMASEINWIDLGRIDYEEAFNIQEKIHSQCVAGTEKDTLLYQENPPTITLGRGTHPENLLVSSCLLKKQGFVITEVSRGGDISYHGPGQLVVSPIVHFENYVSNAIQFVRTLEQVVIDVLDIYAISGKRIKGLSGVWVQNPKTKEDEKISALGIAIIHGVSCHGISINIHPDLEHFKKIIPCGIEDKGVTSMACFGVSPSVKEVRNNVTKAFDELFGTLSIEKTVKK